MEEQDDAKEVWNPMMMMNRKKNDHTARPMPTLLVARRRAATRAAAGAGVGARGLTLIEVLIVIAILLAIAGLVIVNLLPQKEHADIDLQKVQLSSIEDALQQFKLNMKRYPSEEEGLKALWDKSAITNEDEIANWRGPYLEKPIVKDTWGSEFIYRNPGEQNPGGFDLISIGPDKQEGTEDDITNRAASSGTAGGNADTGDTFAPPPTPPAGGGSNKGG